MRKYKYEKKWNHKFQKKKMKSEYKTLIFHYKKIIFIIILSIIYFIKNSIKRLFSEENIDPNSLPLSEHYKILFPKKKHHNYKRSDYEGEINLFKLEGSADYKKMKELGKDTYIYHSCMVTKAKHENLYIREFVEYYLNLGVEKFYLGDDNEEDLENLSDLLDDYIKKGIVDVEYIYFRNLSHYEYFEYTIRSVKLRCKWFLLYDVDEYLEFVDKNMTLKSYLDMPMFEKCDSIKIHWIIYDDNNLVYYDNRTLKVRFPNALPNMDLNIYHKSILKGKDYGGSLFDDPADVHQPNSRAATQCDAHGDVEYLGKGIMGSPKFKYCFIRHHTYKTAEEFAIKILKGMHQNEKIKRDDIMDYFVRINNLTDEKLQLIEHIVNYTFEKFHKNKNSN